jgi:hypothetical protein
MDVLAVVDPERAIVGLEAVRRAASRFLARGGTLAELRVQQLPADDLFDYIVESFPQPLGKRPAGVEEARARIARLAPGGTMEVLTESDGVVELYTDAAKERGVAAEVTVVAADAVDLPRYVRRRQPVAVHRVTFTRSP